jgi:hypothetical protein
MIQLFEWYLSGLTIAHNLVMGIPRTDSTPFGEEIPLISQILIQFGSYFEDAAETQTIFTFLISLPEHHLKFLGNIVPVTSGLLESSVDPFCIVGFGLNKGIALRSGNRRRRSMASVWRNQPRRRARPCKNDRKMCRGTVENGFTLVLLVWVLHQRLHCDRSLHLSPLLPRWVDNFWVLRWEIWLSSICLQNHEWRSFRSRWKMKWSHTGINEE